MFVCGFNTCLAISSCHRHLSALGVVALPRPSMAIMCRRHSTGYVIWPSVPLMWIWGKKNVLCVWQMWLTQTVRIFKSKLFTTTCACYTSRRLPVAWVRELLRPRSLKYLLNGWDARFTTASQRRKAVTMPGSKIVGNLASQWLDHHNWSTWEQK